MFLAPVDGFTDAAFRMLCQRHGAEYCYTEMVSVAGLCRESGKVLKKMHVPKNDNSGVQLFGADAQEFAKAVEIIEQKTFAKSIDINLGCPMQKVTKISAGSALLGKPKKIAGIMPDALGCSGVNLLHSAGESAWQEVMHFHLHIIPRYKREELQRPFIPHSADKDELKEITLALNKKIKEDFK